MEEKLSFDELMILFKKDKQLYINYLDNCSWDDLMNYANKGLESCNKDILESNNLLEKTINKIDLSNLYIKCDESPGDHVN